MKDPDTVIVKVEETGLPMEIIIAIIVGAVVIIILLVAIVAICAWKYTKKRRERIKDLLKKKGVKKLDEPVPISKVYVANEDEYQKFD